jgi:hypothetical protein
MAKCGKRCEVWTRCVGYHRPVKQFNLGKQAEFADRVPYKPETEQAVSIPVYGPTRREKAVSVHSERK